MSIKPAKVQFNGGELSPWLAGRTDIAKYDKTAKLCRNFIPLAEGSLKRRGGTRFVAATPEDEDVIFRIVPNPEQAEVYINGVKQAFIYLARGDEVAYEVRCDGFIPVTGKKYVTEDETLPVFLQSKTEMFNLTINPTPADATVKIDGVERMSARFPRNKEVVYLVYANNYKLHKGTVVMTENKEINVKLEPDEQAAADYGDWGKPEEFVACSVTGSLSPYKKCFYIRFSNGFLPVVFPLEQKAPSAPVDESQFLKTDEIRFNSVVTYRGYIQHAVLMYSDAEVTYTSESGKLIFALSAYEIGLYGWPKDKKGNFVFFYEQYVGVVVGNIVRVYMDGELVWELKGRNNG